MVQVVVHCEQDSTREDPGTGWNADCHTHTDADTLGPRQSTSRMDEWNIRRLEKNEFSFPIHLLLTVRGDLNSIVLHVLHAARYLLPA